jgi:hypothetical protein
MPRRSLDVGRDPPFLDFLSYARAGPGQRLHLLPAQIEQIARHLRAQGIAANATLHAVRGVTKPQKSDGIYRAMRAGRSTHIRGRAESVGAALRAGNIQIEPGKAQLLDTRRSVVRGWLGLRETLRADGRDELARGKPIAGYKHPCPADKTRQARACRSDRPSGKG